MTIQLTAAALALGLSFWLTTVVKRLAFAWNFVDEPDGRRKTHRNVVPLGGGLAVATALVVGLGIHALLFREFAQHYRDHAQYLLGLFLSSVILCGVGVLDDRSGLRGRQKLFGQLIAVAALLAVSGMSIKKLGLFGGEVELGVMAIPFTVFWLLGAINALNLMDGIDGLAATIGATAAFALAGMCLINGRE